LEGAFLELSQGKSYFGGDGVGYLDIALVSFVGWVRAVEKIAGVAFLDQAKVPNLAAWAWPALRARGGGRRDPSCGQARGVQRQVRVFEAY
jgi:glutathione S-transferase